MASAISGSQKRYPQISFGRRERGAGQGGNALLTVRTIEKPKSNLFKAGRTSFNGVAAAAAAAATAAAGCCVDDAGITLEFIKRPPLNGNGR